MTLFACVLGAVALLVTTLSGQTPARKLPIVLDTDIGDDIDDALALALVLRSPEFDLKAVITVLQQGERRADLTYKVLKLYGREEVPVGAGAEQTLMGPPSKADVVQLKALGPEDVMPAAKRQNGLRLMIDTIMRSPEKITLVAVGPLTNVALALRSEPRLVDKLERIVLMNGVFFRAGLEYNTYRDAEASAIVYSSGVPIQTVGLDVTMQCQLSVEQMKRFWDATKPAPKFLGELIRAWNGGKETQRPVLHDPLAVLALIQPDLVRFVPGTVRVETKGLPGLTEGLTAFKDAAGSNLLVAKEVKASAAVDLFLRRLLD